MAAITTHLISSVVKDLQRDYPQFRFTPGEACVWSPSTQTIHYTPSDGGQLLHELAHALLGHANFSRDIDLIALERDAWHYAQTTLAPHYAMTITPDTVDEAMDTYRQWLHDRSTCPSCEATGVQTKSATYHCLLCSTDWHVNDARACGLRRVKLK